MFSHSNDPHRYDDMLELPHHISTPHPQMSPENRAAQFAPFTALTGYDAAVKETARQTDKRIELSDDDKILLNGKLQLIRENIKTRPQVTITFFQPDEKKDGGAYGDVTGIVKMVDEYKRQIILESGGPSPLMKYSLWTGRCFQEWSRHGWPGFAEKRKKKTCLTGTPLGVKPHNTIVRFPRGLGMLPQQADCMCVPTHALLATFVFTELDFDTKA